MKKLPKLKIETLFLVLAILFGVLTSVIQPIFSAPDEYTHFKYAYSIFDSNPKRVFSEIDRQISLLPNQPSQSEEKLATESATALPAPESKLQRGYQTGDFLKQTFSKKLSVEKNLRMKISFGDIKWLPQAIGMLIGRIIHPSVGVIVLAGRLFNLFVYIVAIYFAIKKAKMGQWTMAAVALLPMSIQQAASLSYDVLYYVAIFVAFSLLTNFWVRKNPLDWKGYVYTLLTIVLLLIPKEGGLALGLFFITAPTILFGKNNFTKLLDSFWKGCAKHKKLTALAIIFIFLAYILYEFKNYGGAFRGLQVLFNTFFRSDLYTDLDNLLVTGMIGNFGQLTYRLPAWLVVLNFIFLFILLLAENKQKIETRTAVAGLLIFLAVPVMIAVGMFKGWTRNTLNLPQAMVSLGGQGRYYTPFLITLIPFGIYMKKYLNIVTKETTIRAMFKGMMLFNLVYFLILTILYYYTKDLGVNLLPELSQHLRGLF